MAAWDPVLDPVAPNLELTPTDIVPLLDGTGRKLVATLGGTIRVLDQNDQLQTLPLLTTEQVGLQLQRDVTPLALAQRLTLASVSASPPGSQCRLGGLIGRAPGLAPSCGTQFRGPFEGVQSTPPISVGWT